MIKDEVFNKCTRCGKEFTDLKVSVELSLFVERLRDTGVWEDVPNMNQESREYLCPDCFNKLCDILAQMNLPQTSGTMSNDRGVILPVEERVSEPESDCKCGCNNDTNSTVHKQQEEPSRHRHESFESREDDNDIIEYVITSKIVENGVEVPGPDDGKVVRMTRKEWEERQKQNNNNHPLSHGEEKQDLNHRSDADLLVDVCDDVIYG